jgi:hypothetical protein
MFTLMGIFGYGVSYYWNNGPANMDNVSAVFEANLQMDELKKRQDVKEIEKLIGNDRVRDAVKALDVLGRDSKKLNEVKEVSTYRNLETSLRDTKNSLNKLLSYPELSSVILVLGNKVSNFENFVVQNQWRTLTRMSRRIKAKVTPGRVRSPGFFTYKKINSLERSIRKDIKVMIDVTEGSVLSRQDKNLILTKIKTLKTELTMLANYIVELKRFRKDFSGLKKNFTTWFEVIGPEVSYKRIELEKNSQNFLFSLIGILAFLVLAVGVGVMVNGWSKKNDKRNVQEYVIKAIKDGIIPIESEFESEFPSDIREEYVKYREYIHKRMSFGSVFQEAMPFSSMVLDSNLNIVWANPLFYEHWGLQDRKNNDENITWDFLQRFTNLGENDPVLSALNEKVAGIYQIQVKTKVSDESLPFEMYVSPVEYAGQSRIMIFFYPLRSIEETLQNQSKSLVGPVARTLDALTTSQFSADFKEKITIDYDIAGISEIFDKFQKYNDFVNQQKSGLLNEIERLENELYDQIKLVDDMSAIHSQKTDLQKEAINKFNDTKDSIISIVELRNEMEHMYENTISTSKDLFSEEVALLSQAQEISSVLDESVKAFSSVRTVRDEFKILKGQIDQFKGRTGQLVDQLLIFQKNDDNSLKMEQGLSKIKTEMNGFDSVLTSFSKVATTLDVSLSKVQLIMERSETPDFDSLKLSFDDARDKIEADMFNVTRLTRNGQVKDEEMIRSLKGLYQSFMTSRSKLKELESLVQADDKVETKTQNREEHKVSPSLSA